MQDLLDRIVAAAPDPLRLTDDEYAKLSAYLRTHRRKVSLSASLYGSNQDEHRLFADHCTAEVAVRTVGHGRTVDEWRTKPDRPDNHWWDCIVGCAAAASLLGVALPGTVAARPVPVRQKIKMSELLRL